MHYQGLDFLRGVAAISVVGYHLSVRTELSLLFAHGYLAVDFFFVLSGFVIAHAYGDRLRSSAMKFTSFVTIRLVRLVPLVVLGTLLAAFIDVYRPGQVSLRHHIRDIGEAAVLGCLFLPTLWHTTLEATIFPLNGPIWSLFFELFANFLCVPVFRNRHTWLLFSLVAAISLMALIFPMFSYGSIDFGPLPENFILGFPRVAWSFSVGALISCMRLNVVPVSKWTYAIALCAILICPPLSGGSGALFDLISVVVVFPLIVFGAAHCRGAERNSIISRWSGDVSYPLYATHYPLARAIGFAARRFGDTPVIHLVLAIVGAAAMVVFAMGIHRFYDIPVRRWMGAKLGKLAMHRVLSPGM